MSFRIVGTNETMTATSLVVEHTAATAAAEVAEATVVDVKTDEPPSTTDNNDIVPAADEPAQLL